MAGVIKKKNILLIGLINSSFHFLLISLLTNYVAYGRLPRWVSISFVFKTLVRATRIICAFFFRQQ